jgi:hypothetical protein
LKNTKNCQLKSSSIFVLFALLLQNFLFKAETPTFGTLCPRALISRNTPAALSLSGGQAEKKEKEETSSSSSLSDEREKRRAQSGEQKGEKKHDLNCAVELRIAARSFSAVVSPT